MGSSSKRTRLVVPGVAAAHASCAWRKAGGVCSRFGYGSLTPTRPEAMRSSSAQTRSTPNLGRRLTSPSCSSASRRQADATSCRRRWSSISGRASWPGAGHSAAMSQPQQLALPPQEILDLRHCVLAGCRALSGHDDEGSVLGQREQGRRLPQLAAVAEPAVQQAVEQGGPQLAVLPRAVGTGDPVALGRGPREIVRDRPDVGGRSQQHVPGVLVRVFDQDLPDQPAPDPERLQDR